MRRRRIGQAVELRKAKKEDQLLKRRNIANDVEEPTSPLQENNSASPTTMSAEEILYGMIKTLFHISSHETYVFFKLMTFF